MDREKKKEEDEVLEDASRIASEREAEKRRKLKKGPKSMVCDRAQERDEGGRGKKWRPGAEERWEAEMMQQAMKDGTRVCRENRPQPQMHLGDLLKEQRENAVAFHLLFLPTPFRLHSQSPSNHQLIRLSSF